MKVYKKIIELKENNSPFVLVTVTSISGSSPGKIGFKMIVEKNGETTGTIGGGAIEARAIDEAKKLLLTGKSINKKYLLSNKPESKLKDVEVVSMSCNGSMELFYEVQSNVPCVYVFGGGHVGQAVLKFLSFLKYHTMLIDNRPEFANKDINPFAQKIILSDYIKFAQEFEMVDKSFIVILTHGHKYDFEILSKIYERKLKAKYIGVIASKNKSSEICSKLKEEIKNVDLSNLHTPIGLDIGGNSPDEIALSIVTQIQSINYKKM